LELSNLQFAQALTCWSEAGTNSDRRPIITQLLLVELTTGVALHAVYDDNLIRTLRQGGSEGWRSSAIIYGAARLG
jgi:hypothetical protein